MGALAFGLAVPLHAQPVTSRSSPPSSTAADRAALAAEQVATLEEALAQAQAQVQAQHLSQPFAMSTRSALAAGQLAAQPAAQAQAQQADFANNYAPFVVQAVPSPSATDKATALNSMAASLSAAHAQQQAAVAAYAQATGFPLSWRTTNGGMSVVDHLDALGAPAIKTTFNLESAQTVGAQKLWPGGSAGFNLTATNFTIGLIDGGDPKTNHQEFVKNGLRVFEIFGPSSNGSIDHTTHTCGTIAAWGISNAATGYANRSTIWTADFNNDLTKMAIYSVTNGGLRESSHSYGYQAGWYLYTPDGMNYIWVWRGDIAISTNWDWHWGFYDNFSQTSDQIIYAAQTYLPIFSAGNPNGLGHGPDTQPVLHYEYSNGIAILTSTTVRPLNDAQGGFNTLTSYAVAKNDLVVGAVSVNTNGYTGPNSVSIADFSARGATAEGRIKPDVVAPGLNIYSTEATMSYGTMSGTSMAAPAVTGTAGLISAFHQQLYPANGPTLYTNAPLASTLRGLLIHSADQLGTNVGPSYMYGWGLIDPVSAITLVTNNYASRSLAYVKEVRLISGDTVEFPVTLTAGKPFKVTVAWTDPAGTPTAPALNPTNHMLVNDLDLRVIAPNGSTNLPWVLNRSNPTAAATTGDNTVDNVEQVSISAPVSGIYTVRVTHKGNLVNDARQVSYQNLSLLLSGNVAQPPILPHITAMSAMTVSNAVALKWASEVGRIYKVQSRNDLATGTWQDASGELSATKTNTAYMMPMGNAPMQFYRIVQVR